jgi:nucleoid-associated protein YgaU
MKNTTPILVFTGLAILAVAGLAGLTREQWMTQPTPAVATPELATPPTAPPAAAAPAETAAAPAAAAAPAETAAAPAETAPVVTAPAPAAESQQTAAVQPETAAQPVAEPAPAIVVKPDAPAFDTVRIEKTGEALIAGRAEPGSEVVIKLNGDVIGKTVANAAGAFVVLPEKPLPPGSGAITIEATGKSDRQPVTSEQSVAVIVPEGQRQQALVAVVSPDAPTKVLQTPEPKVEPPKAEAPEPAEAAAAEQTAPQSKPAKLVSIDAVDYDAAGNIVFSGQGETGNTARVYVDNSFIGDAPVGEDGRWVFSGTADVAKGVHTLRVDGLDAKGNVVNRVEVPFFREDQTKLAAAEPEAPEAAPAEPAAAGTTTPPPPAPEAVAPATETAAPPQTDDTATAPATVAEAAPAAPKDGRIVIQPGNNLWRISLVLYGTGNKFTMLYEANKDQIRNPDLIYPGQVFRTPKAALETPMIDPKQRAPLKPGDNAATAE